MTAPSRLVVMVGVHWVPRVKECGKYPFLSGSFASWGWRASGEGIGIATSALFDCSSPHQTKQREEEKCRRRRRRSHNQCRCGGNLIVQANRAKPEGLRVHASAVKLAGNGFTVKNDQGAGPSSARTGIRLLSQRARASKTLAFYLAKQTSRKQPTRSEFPCMSRTASGQSTSHKTEGYFLQ
jgi:hypothetical protein